MTKWVLLLFGTRLLHVVSKKKLSMVTSIGCGLGIRVTAVNNAIQEGKETSDPSCVSEGDEGNLRKVLLNVSLPILAAVILK